MIIKYVLRKKCYFISYPMSSQRMNYDRKLMIAVMRGYERRENVIKLLKLGADPYHVFYPVWEIDRHGNPAKKRYSVRNFEEDEIPIGHSALSVVCSLVNNFEFFKLLLHFNCKTFAELPMSRKTALFLILVDANSYKNSDYVRLLLEYGVWPNAPSRNDLLSLGSDDFALFEAEMAQRTPLVSALHSAHTPYFSHSQFNNLYWLIKFGARITTEKELEQVLRLFHLASCREHVNVLFMLEVIRRETFPVSPLAAKCWVSFSEGVFGIDRNLSFAVVKLPVLRWTPDVHALELLHDHPLLVLKTIREVLMCICRTHREVHWDLQKLLFEFVWGSMFNVFF